MTIELITQEEYNILLDIQQKHPILTFQNNGYEYIDKSKFTDEDKKAFEQITDILKKSIKGFSNFHNFKIGKDGTIILRLDYDWNYETNNPSFHGVGYIPIVDLLNGFDNETM